MKPETIDAIIEAAIKDAKAGVPLPAAKPTARSGPGRVRPAGKRSIYRPGAAPDQEDPHWYQGHGPVRGVPHIHNAVADPPLPGDGQRPRGGHLADRKARRLSGR